MKTCRIFGAGERVDGSLLERPQPGDLTIAADGGIAWLSQLSQTEPAFLPNRFVGDFDSVSEEISALRRRLAEFGTELTELPVVKDDTDTGAAAELAGKLGYRRIVIYGGAGGNRFDHTIANLQLLTHLARCGIAGYLVGRDGCTCAVDASQKAMVIRGAEGKSFGVFSAGGTVTGVSIYGAKYELSEGTLKDDFALGVSNSFAAKEIGLKAEEGAIVGTRISCKKGTLLITGEFLPKDCDLIFA